MTDDQQAEAVINGLSQQYRCDNCGTVHNHGPLRTYAVLTFNGVRQDPKVFASCSCGSQHCTDIYCKCGSTHSWGPKAGWRCVRRLHNTWKKREAAFEARIAELTAKLDWTSGQA